MIHSLDGGGAERVMAGLASRLAERDHRVTLILLGDRSSRHDVSPRVTVIPLDCLATPTRRGWIGQRWRRLRTAIARGDRAGKSFDAVLSFCDWTNVMTLAAAWGMDIPVLVAERSNPMLQTMGRPKEWLRRRLYKRARRVICLSDDVAEYLAKTTGANTLVIHSAVDGPPESDGRAAECNGPSSSSSDSQVLRIVAMGRLELEKGFDRLLEALAGMDPGMRDWRLTLLGDGSLRTQLQDRARHLGLDHRINMPGWVRPIWQELDGCDLFVLPSRYEGFPSALLEAMSAGLACVSVDLGGATDAIIRHGTNAWRVGNTVPELTEGLSKIMADDKLRRRLAKNAVEVKTRFGWPSMVDAYEQVLKDEVNSDGNR
ncbi:MAG: glycosyltransferase [Planctomycetota bacterium]